MRPTGYIVPNELLSTSPPGDGWHAHLIPGDETKSVVVVEWVNPNHEAAFESLPGILPLGDRWEIPSEEVSTLLASFAVDSARDSAIPGESLPAVDLQPSTPQTLSTALRKLEWPMARFLR